MTAYPERQVLKEVLDRHFGDRNEFSVLEAGCGSLSYVPVPGAPRVTGIDISEKQLERNEGLDQRILGDLQTYPLPDGRSDCTICWDVLEHLPNPDKALENLVRATRQNGLIVISVPNRNSIKGLITRLTPHAFHVFVYRYVFKDWDAGKEDRAPFKTFLRPQVSPSKMRKFAKQHGLEETLFLLYTCPMAKAGPKSAPVLFLFYRAFIAALKFLTLGRYDGNLTDALFVWRKTPQPARARTNASTSRAASGIFVPGPKIAATPASLRNA